MTAEQRTDGGGSRWLILAACIVAMFAIANLQYAWTLFTTPLMEDLGTSLARIQVAFTIFIIAQTALFPINAYLIDRFSPRIVVTIASAFVTAGWVGAGYAGMSKSLPALYVAYGLGGIGASAVYAASVGAAMKWFPDRRGLCVGFVAGAYGFGAALTVLPIDHMIRAGHYRSAFVTWGLIQGIVVLIAAQFLKMPADDWVPEGWEQIKLRVQKKVQQSSRNYRPQEMLKSRSFYVLYLMMTLATFSGLMVTVQLKPIGERYGYDKYLVLGGVTILGLTLLLSNVLNGVARPFLGWVSDQLGRYDTMAIAFIMGAIAITGFTLLVGHLAWFVILCSLTFFTWGDIYSLFPAAIADIFGNKHATTNYGIQYTAKGVGSIFAAPCAAWLMAEYDSWLPVFWLAVACNVTAALLAVLWLKPLITRLMREQISEKAQGAAAEPAGAQAAAVTGATAK
jgi:OFA family oxalate/formate antiporter-like MFS transporter